MLSSMHNGGFVCEARGLDVSSVCVPVLVGCGGPEAAVGPQSEPVSREPISVGQRPGRIPQRQADCAGGGAHTQQLCSRSVTVPPLG